MSKLEMNPVTHQIEIPVRSSPIVADRINEFINYRVSSAKKVTEPPIIQKIIDAFAHIEVTDRAVDEITIPARVWMSVNRDRKRYGEFFDFKNGLRGAELWGAKVRIGPEFRVSSHTSHPILYGEDEEVRFSANNEAVYSPEQDARCGALSDIGCIEGMRPWKVIHAPVWYSAEEFNRANMVESRAAPLSCFNLPEARAIETLRDAISESDYRKYMTHGFLLVKAASGKTYQVFRDKRHTKVWFSGVLIEEVCVRISDKRVPPTDSIIAFKAILETDEDEFRRLGNVYKMSRAA